MNKGNRHFWVLLLTLLACGIFINFLEQAGEARIARRALREFPSELGAWRQQGVDVRFDAAAEAVLRADDYVMRDYSLPSGQTANFYIGYYATQRSGATYHSPLNCLPGSGWTMTEPATIQINPADGRGAPFEANRYIIQNGDNQQLLVYWYQGRGRAVASEYWDKAYTMMDSVRRRRSDGAMVRVIVPVATTEEAALRDAVALAAEAAPHLRDYVPE